jgi:hypothetical protein
LFSIAVDSMVGSPGNAPLGVHEKVDSIPSIAGRMAGNTGPGFADVELHTESVQLSTVYVSLGPPEPSSFTTFEIEQLLK